MARGKVSHSLEEKVAAFWSRVNKQGPYPDIVDYPTLKTRCWIWTGATWDGYGHNRSILGERKAHRICYILAKGKIPRKKLLRHRCDNPSCVRPSHLRPGTQKQNMEDRNSRGR